MAQCPVCGEENPPDASNCRSCQLATSLFEPVREAAGTNDGDAEYAHAIAEMLAGAGPEGDPSQHPDANAGSQTMLTAQARFPALSPAARPAVVTGPGPSLPAFPMLAPGSGLSLVQRQVEELVQVGRREGLDLKDVDPRMFTALREESLGKMDDLRRALFVRVAASVAEDLEIQTARRNELAPLVPTSSVDVELGSARVAFETGDLSGVVRRLRQASDGLSGLEDRWATCQILTTEADLMVETLQELGQDPAPAMGPLTTGRRLARAGESERAERVLAGANRVLWGLLVPQLNTSLQSIRTQLQGRPPTDVQIEPVIHELRQLAALIRRRNFGAAVTAFRRLRAEAAALASPSTSETASGPGAPLL